LEDWTIGAIGAVDDQMIGALASRGGFAENLSQMLQLFQCAKWQHHTLHAHNAFDADAYVISRSVLLLTYVIEQLLLI
jgi:hypothetical protein